MDFKYDRPRSGKILKEKIIEELVRVAQIYNYFDFSYREFDKHANISANTTRAEFGKWSKAKGSLKDYLKSKGLRLETRKFRQKFTEKDIFDEMERIWRKYGHRPSAREWDASDAKISSTTFKERFNGWSAACLKFIEFKMGKPILVNDEMPKPIPVTKSKLLNTIVRPDEEKDSRIIPMGVRLKVLDRDSFRCVFCGRSPATEVGVQLHMDHIIPYSKCGKSTVDNLQTLCLECNLGKGNKENIGLKN